MTGMLVPASVTVTTAAPRLIVLDNSDEYHPVAAELRRAGLLQFDFNGFGPYNAVAWRTSLFVASDAALPRRPELPEDGDWEALAWNDARASFRDAYSPTPLSSLPPSVRGETRAQAQPHLEQST